MVRPAFYHWQTQLKLTATERNYLDSIGAKKLYAKFFDVDWDAETSRPVPLAAIEMDTTRLGGLEIVPTIFITNRTLLNMNMQEVEILAGRISQKIKSISPQPPHEVQFDCDWTPTTQAKFFLLLERFKEKMPDATLSATIRLHQLKYPEKTGIPPVDRGMLMCYNMGDLDDWATENSILDLQVFKSYLPNRQPDLGYPLPLDVALPLFRWGVLFREGRLIKLLNNLSEADLQDVSRFKKSALNRYEVVKSTYLQAHYLYAGDLLRLEQVSQGELEAAAAMLGKLHGTPEITVAFYHLDTSVMQFFPQEKIRAVLERF